MFEDLQKTVLPFVDSNALAGEGPGRYRYSAQTAAATLYSSSYAAMVYSLLGKLEERFSPRERAAWAAYLNSHQDEDGLFRDPVIFDEGWYENDPLWCGRPHLSCHIATALACLGSRAEKPITFLEPYKDPEKLLSWLGERDFVAGVSWVGNEIMNIGTLLQY
jgi:hypothetical protein